jgi:hypothetical protein
MSIIICNRRIMRVLWMVTMLCGCGCVRGLTYDNNFNDPEEALTRHTKTKRRTHVAMDDLELGDLDPAEAARHVMDRIGANVRFLRYRC